MKEKVRFLGLDVHAETIAVAVAEANGEVRSLGTIAAAGQPCGVDTQDDKEAGADAFTIMKLAGHSSVTVSQRYVHPTGETVQLAFDRLETLNRRALKSPSGKK